MLPYIPFIEGNRYGYPVFRHNAPLFRSGLRGRLDFPLRHGSRNGETAAEQTADVLAQTDRWLAECGSDKAHVLDAVIYLRDMGDYAEMNGVWDAWVAAGRTPARACVEARLARPEWRVEIKITAVKRDAATA